LPFISHKHRFIFVHVPKTAGTSIKKALFPYADKNQIRFEDNHDKVTDCPGWRPHRPMTLGMREWCDNDGWLSFTVVRNPYARYASQYHRRMFEAKNRPQPGNQWILKMNFRQFLNKAMTPKSTLVPRHHELICGPDGELLVDELIHFESLKKDFRRVCEKLGLGELNLKHYKRNDPYDYRDLYDPDSIATVTNYCQQDLKLLKYNFGDPG